MKAELLQRDRWISTTAPILEMVDLARSYPGKGSTHHYKYRLFYGYPGKRIVGYDNERSKGDHRHVGESEDYTFSRTWRHGPRFFLPTYLDRGQQMKKATIRIRRRYPNGTEGNG